MPSSFQPTRQSLNAEAKCPATNVTQGVEGRRMELFDESQLVNQIRQIPITGYKAGMGPEDRSPGLG